MIINVRGPNGSGKSTLARQLIGEDNIKSGIVNSPDRPGGVTLVDLAHYKTPGGKQRHVEGYVVESLGLVVVGLYRTDCGGCDGIKTQQLIKDSVKRAAKIAPNVFFEGVIVSTLFQGYLDLSYELMKESNEPLTWAYLDTPVDVCLARIQQRNGGKAIKEDLVRDKFKSIAATKRKAMQAGEIVADLHYNGAADTVREWLALGRAI